MPETKHAPELQEALDTLRSVGSFLWDMTCGPTRTFRSAGVGPQDMLDMITDVVNQIEDLHKQ